MSKTFYIVSAVWLGFFFLFTLVMWLVVAESWDSWPVIFIVPLGTYLMPFGGLMSATLMEMFD